MVIKMLLYIIKKIGRIFFVFIFLFTFVGGTYAKSVTASY